MRTRRGEFGFSMIELMIAMLVTLIVTGAVYGLIAGGGNAFRREPELTDRQQNIRVAMDVIMRDVANAGIGVPAFIQTFTRGLNACNASATSPAPFNTPRTCPDGETGAIGSPYGTGANEGVPDDIQLIGNPGNFDGEQTCHYGGGKAANVRLRFGSTAIRTPVVVLVFMRNGTYSLVNINDTQQNKSGAGDCTANQNHIQLNFNQGGDTTGLNQPGGLCSANVTGPAAGTNPCEPITVARGEIIRYGIRLDEEGVPNLYRFSTGTLTGAITTTEWQLVARGIEDMQVQYRHVNPVSLEPEDDWADEPRVVAGCNPLNMAANCCDPGCVEPGCKIYTVDPATGAPMPCLQPTNDGMSRLVTEVRVTLSARAEGANLEGQTSSATGGNRVRGSLTQTIAPRAALFALSARPAINGGPAWR